MRELMRFAAELGVRVHIAHMHDEPNLLGYYSDSRKVVVIRFGLTPFEFASVLAHELAHAYFSDTCSSGANERRAARFAAHLLISPEAYAAAEAISADPWDLAECLRVTVDVVCDYQEQCLQRLGRRTYGRSWRTGLSGELARQLSS